MDAICVAKNVSIQSSMKYHLGAVILDKKKRIIARGFNKHYPSNVLKKRMNVNARSMHAEMSAIRRLLRMMRGPSPPSGPFSLIVVRTKKNGDLANCCPCVECRKVIDSARIDTVMYSDGLE
jgi:deoxycytidylate deaminase